MLSNQKVEIFSSVNKIQISEEKYNAYFFALKSVFGMHREYKFGKSPDIPSGFSESLCRHILNLQKSNDRTHDAINTKSELIEIKATGSKEGKTTISNKNKFDLLIWMFVDFENDSVNVHRFNRDMFSLSGNSDRKSISLSGIAKRNAIVPDIYSFQKSSPILCVTASKSDSWSRS